MTAIDTTIRPVTADLPVDHAAELARINRIAGWLDARWGIPFTPFRFGLDSVVGLIPGVGDTIMLAPSAYMIWRAHKLGVPRGKITRMAANTGIDYVTGLVPLLGDAVDFVFKANLRNARILQEHLQAQVAT